MGVGEGGGPVEAEEGLLVEEERLGHGQEGGAVDDGVGAGHAPGSNLAEFDYFITKTLEPQPIWSVPFKKAPFLE